MSEPTSLPQPVKMTGTVWLICIIASLGFAFDIYELLMMPLIGRPALAELLNVDPATDTGNRQILNWFGYIQYSSAVCGGIFGMLGGYLTDRLGRRTVLTYSILLYAFSAFAAGFATSALMLLVFRCLIFIGVCVEFVAAVAWLAELFPHGKQREAVLGYTQAFSSVGGIMISGFYYLISHYADQFPAIYGEHAPWRYTLISGLIPAIPLIVIRPFLPESPAWKAKKAAGTLKRPSFGELFQPAYARTTLVTALLFACSYGAAFGAIQLAPQIVPGLIPGQEKLNALRKEYRTAKEEERPESEVKSLKAQVGKLGQQAQKTIAEVQFFQEIGGLLGRCALAVLAVAIVSRRGLLRLFLVPGVILLPLVFYYPARQDLEMFKWGLAAVAFLTVAQFSFWGNYLPRVYPLHLRGTGESFAANVGGRMIGTMGAVLTTQLAQAMPAATPPAKIAMAAAAVGFGVYFVGLIGSFFLPEPSDTLEE